MPRYVVLLRGVNVGTGNRLAMADFRHLLEALGCTTVTTLLNSGNAVVTSPARLSAALAAAVQAGLEKTLGLRVRVVAKSTSELAQIVTANPLAASCKDPSRLLVAFAQDSQDLATLSGLAEVARPPEVFVLGKSAAYISCPNGSLQGAAGRAILGKPGASVTTRNWGTVRKLQELIGKTSA